MSALTECYATLSTPFGELGAFYDALGHRGADYAREAHAQIIAYDDMVVEYVGTSSGLGTVVGLRRLTLGGFAGYAHVTAPPSVGARIAKGSGIALVASAYDNPGSLWSGPHIHTTESTVSAAAAALGVRPLTDPAPTISRAIGASTAGGGTRPIEGDDDMPEILVRQQTPGVLGPNPATYFLANDYIAHIVHRDVVHVENVFGVEGGGTFNQISADDLRRRVELRGLDWATVNALQPGQGVGRDGKVVNAGAAQW